MPRCSGLFTINIQKQAAIFKLLFFCGELYLVSNLSILFDLDHEMKTISMCTHILAEGKINYQKPISNTIDF